MRLKNIFIYGCLFINIACNNNKQSNTSSSQSTPKPPEINTPTQENKNTYESNFTNITDCYWVGMFGDVNKISVKIEEMKDDKTVKGFSVTAGNIRPFSGTFADNTNKDVISFDVKEPGNDKYDGNFHFTITGKTLKGNWEPFDIKQTTSKTYTLMPRTFKYDAAAGGSETSSRLLKEEDVNNLNKEDLRYMRSEIYARHGYAFKIKDIRKQFDYVDWYMPVSLDVQKELTDIENKNIALIKHYEKYAKEYYDDYGR